MSFIASQMHAFICNAFGRNILKTCAVERKTPFEETTRESRRLHRPTSVHIEMFTLSLGNFHSLY